MSQSLPGYLENKIKSRNKFFCHRGKYRTLCWNLEKVYSYAKKFSSLLRFYKIKKGQKVIIKAQNRPEWVAVFLGCLMEGVVVVPIDVNSGSEFENQVIAKVKAGLIVYEGEIIRKSSGIKLININDIEEILSDIKPSEDSGPDISPDDLAEIIFTSGTTTSPKGVMITHGNIEINLESIKPVMERWQRFFSLIRNLKILSLVPLSHMYGQLIGIFIPILISSSVVFMGSINPPEILRAVKEEKIWIIGVLPRVIELVKDYISKKFNLDSEKFRKKYKRFKKIKWQLRFLAFFNIHIKIGWRLIAIMVGGAAFDRDMDEFWRCIAYSIFQGYGLTEAAPLITLSDPATAGAGSIGKALDGLEIKLVNGEIYVKGSNLTPGYFKNSLLTKKAFSGGWFKTGDMAELDEKGNLYFKGRKDSLIVREDGINIYPEDIESVLKEFDSVKDCMVAGLREDRNIRIHAVLILDSGFKGEPRGIIDKANEKLNIYQHINSYSVWAGYDFPRTATKKIKRDEVIRTLLKERKENLASSRKSFSKNRAVIELLRSLKEVKPGALSGDLELERDLGLDSLDLAQLSGIIEEKYDIEVNDSYISKNTKISELENLITSPPEKGIRKVPFYNFPFWLPVRMIRTVFQFIIYPFSFLIYRLKVYGKEDLKEIKSPVVFAANHTSILDSFVILYSLPFSIRRKVVVLMSIEYHFRHFFYNTGAWWIRVIEAAGFYLLVNLFINAAPISRTYGFKKVMENTGKIIDKGWHILIYPEGMVTTDGYVKKFEPGVGIIALDMGVPVIPVKVKGLFNILRNGVLPWGHLPVRPVVEVFFSKMLKFRESGYRGYREIASIIEEKVKAL